MRTLSPDADRSRSPGTLRVRSALRTLIILVAALAALIGLPLQALREYGRGEAIRVFVITLVLLLGLALLAVTPSDDEVEARDDL